MIFFSIFKFFFPDNILEKKNELELNVTTKDGFLLRYYDNQHVRTFLTECTDRIPYETCFVTNQLSSTSSIAEFEECFFETLRGERMFRLFHAIERFLKFLRFLRF